MKNFVSVSALAIFVVARGTAAAAQLPEAAKFDAATVRRVDLNCEPRGMKRQVSPSRITMTSVSLGYCIRWAYGIRDYQLIGPDWVVAANLAHYDIGAVTSEPSSEDRLKALSRTLLAQRFGLEMHQETRSIPMFALRVVKDGPKFSKAPDDENAGILPAGQYAFAAHNTTMARLAEILASPWTARPVIDETGLPGGYDFHLDLSRYVTDEQTRQPVPGPNGGIDMESATMVSLPDELGLRLVPTHAPTDVLIVDRANKDPAEN